MKTTSSAFFAAGRTSPLFFIQAFSVKNAVGMDDQNMQP